jgi:hypothetical protein
MTSSGAITLSPEEARNILRETGIRSNKYMVELMYKNNDIHVVMGFYGLLRNSTSYDEIIAPKNCECDASEFFRDIKHITSGDCSYYDYNTGSAAAALKYYEFYLKCKSE